MKEKFKEPLTNSLHNDGLSCMGLFLHMDLSDVIENIVLAH